jgi:hypothetical protein
MKKITKSLIRAKSKKGLLPQEVVYTAQAKQPVSPQNNYDDTYSLLQDTTVSGILLGNVAKISRSRFIYKGKEKRVEKFQKLWETKFLMPLKMPQIYANSLLYFNIFLEKNFKGTKVIDLDTLETREMKIIETKNGRVQGYVQNNPASEGKEGVPFTANQVLHIPIVPITTDRWGYSFNKNLINVVQSKQNLLSYLNWLVSTNQFRSVHMIKEGADEGTVEEYMTYLQQSENVPTKPLATEGDLDIKQIRNFSDGQTFISLLNYYNSEILRLMQTPPIVGGITDGSNRSSTEGQGDLMESWFDFIDKRILDHFNYILLPDLGFKDIEIGLSPRDKRITKSEIEVIVGLKDLGLNIKGLEMALKNAGMIFDDGVELEEPEPFGFGNPNEEPSPFNQPPSRKPKDNDLKDRKSGSESSTRPDQIGQKSKRPDYNSFPYIIS